MYAPSDAFMKATTRQLQQGDRQEDEHGRPVRVVELSSTAILGLAIFAAIRHLLLAGSISSSDFCILSPIHSLPQLWAATLRYL